MNDFKLTTTRRAVIAAGGAVALLGVTAGVHAAKQEIQMGTFKTRDEVEIYFKDWVPRSGEVVLLSHG